MNALCNSKIIGRSVLTIDHIISLEKAYTHSHMVAQDNYSSTYYLWYTNIVHQCKNYDPKHTGVLLLESIKKEANTASKLLPIGILYFTCSIETRNSFLHNCQFDYIDIISGKIKIILFNSCQILDVEKYLYEYHNGQNNNWIAFYDFLMQTLDQNRQFVPNILNITNACIIERWNAVSILKQWLETCGVTKNHSKYYQDNNVRTVNFFEHNWLFLQVSLRYTYHASIPRHLINKAILQIQLSTSNFPTTATIKESKNTQSITNTLKDIEYSSIVGCDIYLTQTLLSCFMNQQTALNNSMLAIKTHVGTKLRV